MKRFLVAAAALFTAVAVSGLPERGAAQSASAWPTFHGNAQRTGTSPAKGPVSGVAANKWTLPKAVESSPVVDTNGTAYVGASDNKVYALSPSTPTKPKWSFDTGSPVLASPTLSPDGKTLFVSTSNGTLYSVNTADGSKVWSQSVSGSAQGAPLVSSDGSTLYVGSNTGTVYGLKTSDGSKVWSITLNGAVRGSIALSPDGSTVYAATGSNSMYGISTGGNHPGTITQQFYLDGPGLSTPVLDPNGNIYVTVDDPVGQGALDSFTATSGTARFNPKVPHAVYASAPAVFNGQVFFGDANGNMYSFSTSSGQQNWLLPGVGGLIQSSPVITAGNSMLYVGSSDGVYAIDVSSTSSPKLVWSKYVGVPVNSTPAVGPDGSVWVGAESGEVFRFSDVTPPNVPGTPQPGAKTATPTPTTGTNPVPTQNPGTGATPVCALAASLKSKVKDGAKQSIKITCAARTVVHVRVNYPNGDHQSKAVTTGTNGKVTYSYKQGASKVKHNRLYANVILKAGAGASQVSITKQYKILFGQIDASAEPRQQSVGKMIDIYVHTSKKTRVVAYVIFPNGSVSRVNGKTGPKGWAHMRFKVPRGKTRGSNHRVKVLAKLASGRPNISTSTYFTVK